MKRVVDVLYGLKGYANATKFAEFKTDLFANGATPAITMDTATTNGISITGATTTGISVTGQSTATGIWLLRTAPTVVYNAIYPSIVASSNWTGSLAGVRSLITSSATGAIGNARSVMGILVMSAQPSSQGHTAAGYFETTATAAATNITGVISLVQAQGAGGASTPFINIINASSVKSTVLMEIGTGGAVGTSTDGTALFDTDINL